MPGYCLDLEEAQAWETTRDLGVQPGKGHVVGAEHRPER